MAPAIGDGTGDDWRKLVASASDQWSTQRAAVEQALAQGPTALTRSIPTEYQLALAFAAGLGLGLALPRLRAPFRRFSTVDDIPMGFFHQERRLRAVSVGVSDGDTFRARHLPLLRGAGSFDGKKSDNTLQIRLAGIGTLSTALI
jgi:micrococcal nuclease